MEVLEGAVSLGELDIGEKLWVQEFPKLRFPADLEEQHAATVALEVYWQDQLLIRGELTLTGVPVHRVTGVVRGETGEVLEGIPINIDDYSSNYDSEVYFSKRAISDENGAFELNLPSGRYRLEAQPDPDSRWGGQDYYDVSIQEDTEIEFILPWTFFLTGVVRDADGNPVGGQQVRAISKDDGGWSYVSTRINGGYTLKLPRGIYTIQTYSSGMSAGTFYPSQEAGEIELEEDRVLDIQLGSGVELAFHLVDEQGADLEGVWVSVQRRWESTGLGTGAFTDRDGRGKVALIPDVYTVSVSTPPTPYLPVGSLVAVRKDTTVQVVLRRGVRLAGRVVDENGDAIGYSGRLNLWNEDGMAAYRTVTVSREGDFSVGVEPGRYRITISFGQEGTLYPRQEWGFIEIEEDTDIDIKLRRGVNISGKIVDKTGRRQRDGYIQFVSEEGLVSVSGLNQFDADGTYAVSLVPGRYQVYVRLFGNTGSPPSQFLGQVSVAQDTVLNWVLRNGEVFRGRVVDTEGRGVPEFNISASSLESSASNQGVTDAEGFFSMQLLPGRYQLLNSVNMVTALVHWNLGEIVVPSVDVVEVQPPLGATLWTEIMDSRGRSVPGNLRLFPEPFTLRDLLEGEERVSVYLYEGNRLDIDLVPGRYAVVAKGEDGNVRQVIRDMVIEDEAHLDVVLSDTGDMHSLTGQMRRRDGKDLEGSIVIDFYEEHQDIIIEAIVQGYLDGRYRAELPAGTYQVAIRGYEQGERTVRRIYEYGPLEVTGDRTWDVVLGDATAVVDESGATPAVFALWQNYPNPFNARTVIAYQLPQSAEVELVVYNIMGQKVKTLVRETQEAGTYRVEWDGTDASGRAAGSGVYLYRLRAGDFLRVRRIALMK